MQIRLHECTAAAEGSPCPAHAPLSYLKPSKDCKYKLYRNRHAVTKTVNDNNYWQLQLSI